MLVRMTMTPTGKTTSLAQRVAAEIRAEMARQLLTQSELARRLGVIEMWLSRRLRGRQPLDLDELERIASVINVPVPELIERAGPGVTLGLFPSDVTRPAGYPAGASHPAGSRRPMRLSSVAA